MNKDQILNAAGQYADNYEKENGFITHPKTASFHGYIAGYDDAKLEFSQLQQTIAELEKGQEYYKQYTIDLLKSRDKAYSEIESLKKEIAEIKKHQL